MTTKEFNRLSKKKQKILVAKDVQAQLLTGNLRASHKYTSINNIWDFNSVDSAQEILNKGIKCEGCARGALFLSLIRFKNNISIYEARTAGFSYSYHPSWRNDSGTKFIESTFSKTEQAQLESAYEGNNYDPANGYDPIMKPNKKATEYGKSIRQSFNKILNPLWTRDSYVLWWLMQNIIDNDGKFVVPG